LPSHLPSWLPSVPSGGAGRQGAPLAVGCAGTREENRPFAPLADDAGPGLGAASPSPRGAGRRPATSLPAAYAASGAYIEAARTDDGARELRPRFPGGGPDAAAEAPFREHAASGLLARASGVASDHASPVELPNGTLALRLCPPTDVSAAPPGEAVPSDPNTAASVAAVSPPDDASPLGPGLPPLSLAAVA